MSRQPQFNATPARSQRASAEIDTDTAPKRDRYRAFMFVRHASTTDRADESKLRGALVCSGAVDWLFVRHGIGTACVSCAGAEEHLQGAFRFKDRRDLHVVAAMLPPGYRVAPLVGGLAWRNYGKYLSHEGFHEVVASFDYDAFVARWTRAPRVTFKDVKRRVFEGELSPTDVAREYPDIYMKHPGAIRTAAVEGERLRREFDDERWAHDYALPRVLADRSDDTWDDIIGRAMWNGKSPEVVYRVITAHPDVRWAPPPNVWPLRFRHM
ncbi:hypothetical protein [Gordonia pseudamarae]|jgi:hypothetical protein|uniref:Histidine phosphatase family protein n=1 Tax=Gordonia pseudamarae TaxID=2831662 RepID=A0ABX6ILU8_9ACTN|nr:hypothetical protein [Gordonia pseudamarae]QHN36879.1 hypothetical protein GII31_20235 [Gordonia pseudamarae]